MKFRVLETSPGRFVGQKLEVGEVGWQDITDHYTSTAPVEELLERWIDLIKRGRVRKEWEV